MNKITIIGGGPSGLAFAYYLNKKNKKFEIFEASNKVGGNCITLKHNEFYFDSGAHRLHDVDDDTTHLFKKLLRKDLNKIDIPSQIYFNNKFIDFPISPLNIMRFVGWKSFLIEGFKVFYNNYFKTCPTENFKSLAEYRYGSKIAKLFLINYSEKLWGMKAKKLSTEISGKRLKGLSLHTLLIELLFGKSKKTKHLDGSFLYPKLGIGTLFEKLADEVGQKNINLKKSITKIYHKNFEIKSIEINNSEVKNVSNIITTIPIDIFVKQMSPPPPSEIQNLIKKIKYRNIILIALFLNKKIINPNGSMYFPSKDIPFTRIYEPKNRSKDMSPKNQTSLIVELPCFNEDKYWKAKDEKISLEIQKKLISIGLINKTDIINSKIYKIKNAYPVLENDFKNKVQPLLDYLAKFNNLKISGRNGLFAYTHIHDQFVNARQILSYN